MKEQVSRRNMLAALGLSPLAAHLLATSGRAEEVKEAKNQGDESAETVDFLFVQTAKTSSLSRGTLTLGDVGPSTLYFSDRPDRPDRIAGHIATEDFVAHYDVGGEHSFAAVPPNAVVSLLDGEEPQEIVVVLRNPQMRRGNLTYDVEVIDGSSNVSGEATAVFIDTFGRPMTPVSAAGRNRRVRRRARRVRPGPR